MLSKRIEITDKTIMENFLESIDWNVLNDFVKNEYGIETEFISKIDTNYNCKNNIKIFSKDNLVEYTGVFKNVLKEMRLKDFGVWLTNTRVWENTTEETFFDDCAKDKTVKDKYTDLDDIKLNFDINLRYEQYKGGSNGMDLFWASYDKQNGWSFEKVKTE